MYRGVIHPKEKTVLPPRMRIVHVIVLTKRVLHTPPYLPHQNTEMKLNRINNNNNNKTKKKKIIKVLIHNNAKLMILRPRRKGMRSIKM